MEAEEVISLLDSYWYSQQIFKKNTCINPSSSPSLDHHFQENPSKPAKIFNQYSSNHKRSSSDHQMMNTNSLSSLIPPIDSPNSVLQNEKQKDIDDSSFSRTKPYYHHLKKKKSLSKSLSELEFEEVKGFMDLGFVFSEEDEEITSLVEIIPGLQRMITGNNNNNNNEKYGGESVDIINEKKCLISRPYLSEAWDDLDKRKKREKENPLMNWRIPSVNDEINMKDNLKWWAQAVASTVK